jgi:heme-degrading monooxygenase HmoA
MITRVWRGWAPVERAEGYERHYRTEVLESLQGVPGFVGARLLRRVVGGEVEFVSLTFFDDIEAVQHFAGPDYETAVVAGPAREVLSRFDDTVAHYDTAFET